MIVVFTSVITFYVILFWNAHRFNKMAAENSRQ